MSLAKGLGQSVSRSVGRGLEQAGGAAVVAPDILEGDVALLEDGDIILLEDGDQLELQPNG